MKWMSFVKNRGWQCEEGGRRISKGRKRRTIKKEEEQKQNGKKVYKFLGNLGKDKGMYCFRNTLRE